MLRPFRSIFPTVDPSAFVDASAQVIGDVRVGAESSIWMNVVVRGDVNSIRIGARTNLQDLVLVHVMRETHPTVIGELSASSVTVFTRKRWPSRDTMYCCRPSSVENPILCTDPPTRTLNKATGSPGSGAPS